MVNFFKHKTFWCIVINISIISVFMVTTSFRTPAADDKNFLTYDIILNGKNIGLITLQRKYENGNFKYLFTSKADFSLIRQFDFSFDIVSFYNNGKLIESSSLQKINGDTKSQCFVKKEGQYYRIKADGKVSIMQTNAIQYSLTTMYFKEPKEITNVFSERYGQYLSILKTGEKYTISLPDGKKNYYTFYGGICKEVESEILFGKLQFKLKN